MAVSHAPAGFTGTVDQIDEARRFALGGGAGHFRVNGSGDWAITANSGTNRTVNITAGMAVACGVIDITTATETLTFAANAGGSDRFDAVVATFDWAAGTITFRVIQGTTVPPVVVKTGTTVDATKINWLPGLRYDAVIGIIRARPGVTILAPADLYDCRPYGDWAQLQVFTLAYRDYIDFPINGQVRESTGLIWQRKPDGTLFKPAPTLLMSIDNGTQSGGTTPGAVGQGTINGLGTMAAHDGGTLKVKVSGSWSSPGNAAGYIYLGVSPTTAWNSSALSSKLRIHNQTYANIPQAFSWEWYFDTDGSARYVHLFTDTDASGNSLTILTHSWQVWRI